MVQKAITGVLLLSAVLLAVVTTPAASLVSGSTWKGSYIDAYWMNGHKILEIHIVKDDLGPSGYTRTMTIVTLLQLAHTVSGIAQGTLTFLARALQFAGTKILVGQIQNSDGSVDITLVQITQLPSGNWVYAYYGFYPRVFPMPPFVPLYVSTIANYPTPSFSQVSF